MIFEDLFLNENIIAPISPIEIFENNIRKEKFSYLRGDQTYILNSWFKDRNNKDTIVQMNTGGGKTIVGLLQLQSSMNEGIGPAVYLCLDNNLVRQTIENAEQIGIKCTKITEDNKLPIDFLNSEAILVTTFQKMFNGKSIFGINGSAHHPPVKVGTILIDDAHAALNIVRDLFTLKFKKDTNNYKLIINMFKESLMNQEKGTTIDIFEGRDSNGIMMVPYWTWINNIEKLSEEIDKNDDELKFKWPIMRNYLKDSDVLISSNQIEISPFCLPLDVIPSFSMSDRRIYMSATFNDDSSLIKDFGINEEALLRTLKPENNKDIGDKLILSPYNINRDFNRDYMINYLKEKNKVNIVTLVNSKTKASSWINRGFILPAPNEMESTLESLKSGIKKHVVFANRYDGIDLADDICRVLVLDGLPISNNLIDRYSIYVRPDSKLLNIQQAQKIEQGLGRSVRSVNDFSVIFLIDNDLVSRISRYDFQENMTPITVAQIKMGMKVVKSLNDESKSSEDNLSNIVNKVLTRDKGWIQSHKHIISQVKERNRDPNLLKIAQAEIDAYKLAQSNRYKEASDLILNKIMPLITNSNYEKGWYFQLAAIYLFNIDSSKALEFQIKAHGLNPYLLKPLKGIKYEKKLKKDQVQVVKLLSNINNFIEPNSLILEIERILDNIKFDQNSSNECEEAFKELGNILGFDCQRPEKEYNQGPDVLWNIYNENYLIIEVKNEVKISRKAIYKSETEQISNSFNWFSENYYDKKGVPILIIPANKTHHDAFGPKELKVMDKPCMMNFKKNVKKFFVDIAENFYECDEKIISQKLMENKLDSNQIEYFFKQVN